MSEKPIILKDEFRDAKVAKIVYESPTYVSLKMRPSPKYLKTRLKRLENDATPNNEKCSN
jgi:hypothetical protein